MWMLRPAVEDILSTACPDPQSASTFIVAVSELVYKVNLLVCPITSSLLLCLYVCVCVADFYDICDEVDCTGPLCPESDRRCALGTVLGPDGQTCLGETGREGGREGTDKLSIRQ